MRYKAGAASRLDEVQAKRDVLSYQLKFRQAQADLAGSFRDLLALEGNTQVLDTSCPVSPAVEEKLPQGIEVPTVRIDLDSLEGSLSALSAKDSEFSFSGLNHPEVMSLQSQADASRHLAESERGALFPRIVLQAKAYYEYPNVVLPESVWQETLGASLTFPLFEGDLSRSLANEDLKNAASNDFKHEQKLTDLSRDEDKAKDALISLQAQKVICGENINEAQEVERLTYQSYRAGKSRLLDVQDANLKLLEAQVSAAQIDSEILNEMAILAYLSSK